MMQPETRYARLGSERIAYQVLGEGPRDLVLTTGSFSNGDVEWEDATLARLLMRLASFARVIRFDRRGTGASDPVAIQALPPWESYAVGVLCGGAGRGHGRGGVRGRDRDGGL